MKKLVFSFGRFNPPTTGHEVLLKKVVAVAKKENADAMVYSSQSNDPKKNPLPYKEKTKFMKAMFPKHKKVIQYDVGVKNAFDTLSTVYAKGYRDVTMVVGSDRVTEFEKILNKYNDVEGRHGYYNFESGVKVVSAGARDPDAEGVTGMSASKMRAAAAANDFESFEKGMPAGFKGGQSVFDAVRKGMNLSEEMMEFMESDIEGLREFFETDLVDSLCVIDDVELFEFLSESTQNGLIGLDQIKKFESVVDKLFAKYDIDFNFTRHFGDRMDDSRNNPSITLKELAEFIKKMYKRQGKSIKSVAGAEAVLKDIQSDLNIPVAVTYDRNNDEFDVVLKTIMRKKNFTSPDKVIKYEENDMTNQLPEGFMDAMKQLVPGARNPQKPQEGKKTAMEMQFPYARLSVHRMIVALRKARGTAMKGKAQGKDRRENERSLGYILAHVEDIARTRHAEQPNSGRQIHDTKNIDDATQQYFMDKIRQNDWTKTDQEILNAMVGNGTDDNTKGGAYHARTLAHDIALSVKYAKKDAGIKESVELDELKIDMPKKGAGLGITRDKMPQVDEKDYPEYFAYLKEKGITLKKGKEDPNNLKPIQKEFAKIGVEKSLDKMLAQKDKAKFIIVSKDDYIVDGHHRWLAAKNGRQQLNVMRANVNMKELLKATNEFPKTTFKSIKNVVKNMQEVRQDSDIKDKKGTQPAKYYASDADGDKMSKSTKEKRAAYFAKGGSKKPAPGDKGKKTKESEHTKKYRQMFGETKPCWDGYTQQGMKKKGGKMVPNCVPEETVNEEKIDGLVKKSEKSGISYGILKKVYDRGMAAWKSGHRPGTTAQQWAFARVNSFVTKGKGTWGKADKDLAAKVRSESFLPFNEKLDPNKDDMSDYVKDFKKSKAPQFKGKSDDKRKEMAVAAYLAAKEKTESVDEDRDYKKERENYLGTPKQMERNAARSRARRLAIKKGMAERGDGKDIHHKDNNPMNNDPKNLSSVTQKYNRSEPRKRDEATSMRTMKLINKIKNSGVVKKGSMSKDKSSDRKVEMKEVVEFGQVPDMGTLVAFAIAAQMSVGAVRALWKTARGAMKIKKWASKTGHKIAKSVNPPANYTQFEETQLDELSPMKKKKYSNMASRQIPNEKKYAGQYSDAADGDPANPEYKRRAADHRRKLANRKKGVALANEKYDINKSKEDRMNDKLLTMLHKMVTSKGKKESLGSYAFTVAKSFKGISGRELEKMYIKNYGMPESVLDERMFDRMFAGKAKKDDGTRSQADRTMKKYSPKKWAAELKRRQDAEKNGPTPVIKTQAHSHRKNDKGPKGVPHIHVADHNHKMFGGK